MDSKTQLKVDIIIKVAEKTMSIADAEKLLGKSRRTIERYLQRYRQHGFRFAIHQNSGKAPKNKLPDELKKKVQGLIREKYYDVNLQHLAELLETNESINIKRETLRLWAHDIHHVKRAKRRCTTVRKKRERMASEGLMLQMDGSTHRRFGDKKSCLIAMIDDATSELHAEFFDSETTLGCLKVLRQFIEKKGVFKVLYVDRAGIFGGPKRCNFSQVQRACDELGIEIIFANSPQGKGRIERAFDTLQDRLVPELRMQGIQDKASANRYLQEVFIPDYWQATLCVSAPETSELSPPPPAADITSICTIKEYRKIRNDHTFSYGNKFYRITSDLKHSIAQQKIEIRTCDGEGFDAWFANQKLTIEAVIEPSKPTVYDLEIQKKLDAIELAEKLGNVTEAARISGCSRETIYKNRRILKKKGPEALKRTFRAEHHHKNRTDKDVEKRVITFSLENPHLGQAEVSRQLKVNDQIELSPSSVRQIWLREDMNTSAKRVARAKTEQAA